MNKTLKKVMVTAIGGGLLVFQISPTLAQTFEGSASGTFGTPDPGSNANPVFSGVGTNTFTWGDPGLFGVGANELIFDGNPFDTTLNSLFAVGDLTYFNGTTLLGTTVETVPLNVSLNFTTPSGVNETFSFDFDLVSTPNTGTPEENADFVFPINQTPTQSFNIAGVDYTLQLFGFSQDGGATVTDEFRVLEGATTTAELYGRLTVAPVTGVPEPTSALGILALGALGGSSWLKHQSQKKN